MSLDHSLSCPCGAIRQLATTKFVTVLAEAMRSVVHDVEIEPTLLPYEGEDLDGPTANKSQAARVDIRARRFWTRQQHAFFDVRITNPKAGLHTVTGIRRRLLDNERQKSGSICNVL